MIQFQNWRQYTHVVDGVRFKQNAKEPYLLIYFPENTNFIDDYAKLNIRKVDFRIVSVPVTTVPRTRLTPDLIKAYRSLNLIPYSLRQKVPAGKNIILDLSQYVNAIDLMYKPTSYRQRAGFLLKNMILSAANQFPNNYQKVLFYSVDLNNDVKPFINRKIFPLLRDMKAGEFPFNDMMLNVLISGSPKYRLLVKDQDYKFPRILQYIKNLKGIATDQEQQSDVDTASNIVMKSLDNVGLDNKSKIKTALNKYLQSNPDDVTKIVSGDVNADDIKTVATASILYGASGDIDRANMLAKNVTAKNKTKALKAVDRSLAGDLLQPEKAESLTRDETIEVYNPVAMTDGKSPNHV